jgi:hypothetical protein
MQKARHHPTKGLWPLVGVWFQVLFHPVIHGAFHLSFTVLVHYRSLKVFSLTGWCRLVQSGILRPRPTQDTTTSTKLTLTGLSPSTACFPKQVQFHFTSDIVVLQPLIGRDQLGLGYSAFARHYLRNHYCFLFLCLLRCFSSAGLLTLRCT